jgi:hypothetical protein
MSIADRHATSARLPSPSGHHPRKMAHTIGPLDFLLLPYLLYSFLLSSVLPHSSQYFVAFAPALLIQSHVVPRTSRGTQLPAVVLGHHPKQRLCSSILMFLNPTFDHFLRTLPISSKCVPPRLCTSVHPNLLGTSWGRQDNSQIRRA